MYSLIAVSPSDVNTFIREWTPTIVLAIFTAWVIYYIFQLFFGKDNEI